MIRGVVHADEGRIRITVKGHQGRQQDVDAVIDTGYSASLTLPSAIVTALGLRWQTMDRATLGYGSVRTFDMYEAMVLWDGTLRQVLVDQSDSDVLVGMGLLRGYELKMQVRSRGKVTITRLPPKR